ncbi:MAG: NADH-quinone oxidoreductase subunit A [Bdellovibrionales bacterium]|nr:NADH-quinone oxidoreductase subunit A [Bdellovibrionales bacterium]
MDSLVPVLICSLIVLTFGAFMLSLAHWFGAKVKKPASKAKSLPYECGLEGEEQISSRVSVQFYLTAILFILFDIEIIFLYPWALTFKDFLNQGQGLEALVAMIVFLLIFVYGLFWEIGSKALRWK